MLRRPGNERGVGHQIAAPQSAWLGHQAVEPFQPARLHPEWGALQGAGGVVKGRAHANHHGVDVAELFGHPQLLLGATEADPHGASAAVIDALHDGGIFFRAQGAEGGGIGAGNLEAGPIAQQAFLQQIQGGLAGAVQEDRFFSLAGLLAVAQHQIRAVDALLMSVAEFAQHPGHGRAVGGVHVRAFQRGSKRGVLLRRDHRMRIANAHVAALPTAGELPDAVQCFIPTNGVDGGAENAGLFFLQSEGHGQRGAGADGSKRF